MKGHIEVRHSQSRNSWTTPALVANPNISVHALSPGLNYGQQCYEGLKAFRTPSNKITIFRPEFHAARMARSAASVCLPPPPTDLFLECVSRAVAANAELVPPADTEAYLYIRPVLFGASATVALGPAEETILAVSVLPIRPYHGLAALDGIVLEDFDRAAPLGMGAFKVGGNYAPVWRHAMKAKELGFGITLHLDSATRTFVEEFSTSGFLGHRRVAVDNKDGGGRHVLVVPASANAIASATSDTMICLARKAGWEVECCAVPFASLPGLDEVVAVGTAAAAVSVRSISRLSTDEKFEFAGLGQHLNGLARQMADIQRGRSEDAAGWCYEVGGFSGSHVRSANAATGSKMGAFAVEHGRKICI